LLTKTKKRKYTLDNRTGHQWQSTLFCFSGMAISVFSSFSLILFVCTNVSANQEKKENIVRQTR
jgi:hypothetical protein